jgi:hypothetical protein
MHSLSSPRRETTSPCLGDRSGLTTQESEGKVAVRLTGPESVVRFPSILSRSLILHYHLHTQPRAHVSFHYWLPVYQRWPRVCYANLGRLGPLTTPHLLDTIPDHWVSRRFLHFRHGYRDTVDMTDSPQFRYCFTFYTLYFDGFFHLSPRQLY